MRSQESKEKKKEYARGDCRQVIVLVYWSPVLIVTTGIRNKKSTHGRLSRVVGRLDL